MANETIVRMIRLADVCDMIGLKHTAIYERISNGTFPKPIKIGKASRWLETEVQAWIGDQVKATRGAPGPG